MTTEWTIPPAIIDCIANARQPSEQELCAVADHIRTDLLGWKCDDQGMAAEISGPAMRSMSFRAARAALIGCI